MIFTKGDFRLWFEIQEPATAIHSKENSNQRIANLLIHGWTGNRTRLKFIVKQLLEIGQSVVLIDLPGHAESPHNDDLDYSLDTIASLLDTFIRKELIEKAKFSKLNIISHSMGGVIAQIIASKKPVYLQKLVLLATSPNPMKGKKIGYRVLAMIFPLISKKFLEKDKKKKLALGFEYFPEFTPENQKLLPNIIAVEKYLKQIVKINLEKQIQNIECPILLIMGELDSFGDSKAILGFEKNLPKREIIVIENTAHYPFITHKEYCIESIISFLRQD